MNEATGFYCADCEESFGYDDICNGYCPACGGGNLMEVRMAIGPDGITYAVGPDGFSK